MTNTETDGYTERSEKMSDDTLVLTFPKKNILWEDDRFIQIDTTLTREQMILAIMRSESEPTAVMKRDM